MKKLYKIFIILALYIPFVSNTKTVSAEDEPVKTYKNVRLQMKDGQILYRMSGSFSPQLINSVARVNANLMHDKGYTGQNQTVAVIDTGVDFSHPFLAGKRAGEACFTTKNSCPNSTNDMIGSGAARPVHWHGTHVAGIVSGSSATMRGVAPASKIYGINVFETDLSAYEENIIAALQHVNAVRTQHNIVAVNMSLGTTKMWSGYCDSISPELTSIIHTLVANNVAVVAAAGNSYSYGMANPACISKVIGVAATYVDNDNVTEFSNISENTTFAAPGHRINSSAPTNSYRESSGTSMASPHVAGAIALYSSYKPGLSLLNKINDLKANCPSAFDKPTEISVCRIDFNYIATGALPTNPVVTTTTIPGSSTTQPPVTTAPSPTTSTTIVYRTMLGKPRLNTIQLYRNGTAVINYTDPVYGKQLITQYLLSCNDGSSYTFSPTSNRSNHVQYINNMNSSISSCSLRAVGTDSNHGPATQDVFVTK